MREPRVELDRLDPTRSCCGPSSQASSPLANYRYHYRYQSTKHPLELGRGETIENILVNRVD